MGCKITKADGTPCRAPLVEGREWCIFHDPRPDSARTRKAGRKKGGQNRRPILKLVTLPPDTPELPVKCGEDVLFIMGRCINLVMTGQLSVSIGHCIAQMAAVALKAMDTKDVQLFMEQWKQQTRAKRSRAV